jgi:hypothetical protein
MSTFGLFHTAISILAIPVGLFAFARDGKIDQRNWLGKFYFASMLIGTFTGFGFILTKGFNPAAQVLSAVTLVLLLTGIFARGAAWLGRAATYVETFSTSASYLLLMVFTTTETLTRLPVGRPFAAGPDSPELLPVRLGLLFAFVVGVGYQFSELRSARASDKASRPVLHS